MALLMRCALSSETLSGWLRKFETVPTATPARSATSRMPTLAIPTPSGNPTPRRVPIELNCTADSNQRKHASERFNLRPSAIAARESVLNRRSDALPALRAAELSVVTRL